MKHYQTNLIVCIHSQFPETSHKLTFLTEGVNMNVHTK